MCLRPFVEKIPAFWSYIQSSNSIKNERGDRISIIVLLLFYISSYVTTLRVLYEVLISPPSFLNLSLIKKYD